MKKVCVPEGAHIVVLHRWRDSYALYDNYVDHARCRVTYVVTPASAPSAPLGAAAVVLVENIVDLGAVRAGIAGAVQRFGSPVAIVALQEGDLYVAARLREEYGCSGRRWGELQRFLDKDAMLDAARATGVAVPAYRRVDSVSDIHDFASDVGWPLVVKPVQGRASAGVRRLDGPDDLAGFIADPVAPVVVQQHVPHRVYHADGYFDGHAIRPWRLARYVNVPGSVTHGPLAFNDGEPVGEVEVDDTRLRVAVDEFLGALIPGMSPEPWVFHCELFVDENADAPECTFLEVGCRPGGGEIPFVWRDVYGIDLMHLEFALQCGSTPESPSEPAGTQLGGSLLVPLPGPRPAQVAQATSMLGRSEGPYAECLPAVGTVVAAVSGTYEHVGGRFRFSGSSTEDVTRRILSTARDYVVRSGAVIERPTAKGATDE